MTPLEKWIDLHPWVVEVYGQYDSRWSNLRLAEAVAETRCGVVVEPARRVVER